MLKTKTKVNKIIINKGKLNVYDDDDAYILNDDQNNQNREEPQEELTTNQQENLNDLDDLEEEEDEGELNKVNTNNEIPNSPGKFILYFKEKTQITQKTQTIINNYSLSL